MGQEGRRYGWTIDGQWIGNYLRNQNFNSRIEMTCEACRFAQGKQRFLDSRKEYEDLQA
jgi:hypothetical protein